MVIWPAFRMGQYSVNDHPYYAPQFIMIKGIFFSAINNENKRGKRMNHIIKAGRIDDVDTE